MASQLADLLLEARKLAPLRRLGKGVDVRPDSVQPVSGEAANDSRRSIVAVAGAEPPGLTAGLVPKGGERGKAPAAELAEDERLVTLRVGVAVRAPQPCRALGELLDPVAPADGIVRPEIHVEVGDIALDVEVRRLGGLARRVVDHESRRVEALQPVVGTPQPLPVAALVAEPRAPVLVDDRPDDDRRMAADRLDHA